MLSLQASFGTAAGAMSPDPASDASASPGTSSSRVGLGIVMSTIPDNVRTALGYTGEGGVLVSSVVANSPAARAGIIAGSIITHVNGHAVSSPVQALSIVRSLPAGTAVALAVWNAGEERLAVATIGAVSGVPASVDGVPVDAAPDSAPFASQTVAPAPESYDISALPLSSSDPIVVLQTYTAKTRYAEVPVGMSLKNQSQQTATVIKFLMEIADPFGKIIESDGFQLSGTFSPGVQIDPRDIHFLSDSQMATINYNKDISYNTKPAWIFQNRFGPDFYSWQARPVAVRFADGSVWTSQTRYAFVARPTPTPGPTVVVQNNDDCGFFSLFC
jgi:hypothetical protein